MKMNGATLIELIVSMVIIATTLTGVLMSMSTVAYYSNDGFLRQQANAIARSYLEEITAKKFSTSCADVGRANFTSVYCYNGLSESPTDQQGSAISALSSYTVTVTVNTSSATLGALTGSSQVERIDVVVSNAGMTPSLTLSAYVTNWQ